MKITTLSFLLVFELLISFGISEVTFAQTKSTTIPVIISAPKWSSLTPDQKEILASLEEDWSSLSTEQKFKWTQVATKFEKYPPAYQERLKSRMLAWAKLSTNERRIARDNYLKSLNIPNEKKAEAWEAYQQLTPEEKKKLAEEAGSKKSSLIIAPSLKSK